MPMSSAKSLFEHPSYGPLLRAAEEVRKARDYATAPDAMLALLHNAQANLSSGMEALMEHDPLKRDMAKIIFILEASTEIRHRTIGDHTYDIATVTHPEGFRVAVEDCHSLIKRYGS